MGHVIILFISYFLIKIDQATCGILPQWIYFYIPDLLCLPILLGFSSYLLKIITNRFNSFSLLQVVIAAMYTTLVFELILPSYSDTYTSDWLDGLMYFIGAISYYLFSKRQLNQPNIHA